VSLKFYINIVALLTEKDLSDISEIVRKDASHVAIGFDQQKIVPSSVLSCSRA
jgi:hypothetical protein